MARATGRLGSSCCSRFVWCRPGDTAWTSLNDARYPYSDADFTYFSPNQLFYSLTTNGNLESWDVLGRHTNSKKNVRTPVHNSFPPKLQPTMNERQIQLRTGYHIGRTYQLVESCSELLVVVRYSRWFHEGECIEQVIKQEGLSEAYDVYKFDFERKKWVYVPDLGNDRVLFLDNLNSFSFSLSDDDPGTGLISGNSIYVSWGDVYNLDDGSSTSFLPQRPKNQVSSHSAPLWIYPRL